MINSEKFSLLLKTLGRPVSTPDSYSCPVHSGYPDTLHFYPNEILSGGFHIVCTHPKCGFSGSVMDLVAATKRCSVQESSQLFSPGNPLYGLFFECSENEAADKSFIQSEVVLYESRRKAAEYLLQGKYAFLNNSRARQFLINKGIKEDLLQKINLCSPISNAPERLSECIPTKMLENQLVLQYMSGGVATDLVIHDFSEGTRSQHSLEKKSRGLFLYEFLPKGLVSGITVCHDEMDAMVLLSKISDVGVSGINPVAVLDPEAVMQVPGLKAITLLSHSDTPAPLAYVMGYLRLSPSIAVSVVGLPGTLNMVSSTKIRRVFESAVDGWRWLAARINMVSMHEGFEALSSQLAALGLTPAEKNTIISMLVELGITNAMLLDEVRNARASSLIRNCSGISIKRTFAGYEQLMPCSKQLSNFILIVNYFTGTAECKIMAATIKTDRPNCPGYDINIPVKDLMTKDCNKIMYLIWNRLTELGVKFNVEARSTVEIDWFTIIRIFDNYEYKEQTRLIGVEGSFIRYPGVKVNLATGSITTADALPNLPKLVTESYGLVAGSAHNMQELVAGLYANKDAAVNSFLGIMGHILCETARAVKPGYKPRHLIVPCTVPESVTEAVACQVNCLLGGEGELRVIPAEPNEQKKFFADFKLLGKLPAIWRASGKVFNLANRLNNAANSMVVLCPATQLPNRGNVANAYYMSELMCQDHCALSPEILGMLRSRWASMLVATYSADISSEMPAVAWMEKFCGGMPDEQLFTLEPAGSKDVNDYERFLESLTHLASVGMITLAPDEKAFSVDNRRTTDVGYIKGNYVRLNTNMYKIMENSNIRLDWIHVGALMSKNGQWANMAKFKVMPRHRWETLTARTHMLRLLTSDDLAIKTA